MARTVVEVGLHQHEAATILRRLAEIESAADDLPVSESCAVCGRAVPILYVSGPWCKTSSDS
jgi:hypothetical protein